MTLTESDELEIPPMPSVQENDFICRVGPGTPMGEAMRRYWWPVLRSEELPTPSDPLAVRLLGENFVAFRDYEGRVGIIDEYCCHRGAPMILGRVEDCGIRCVYHGWKFAADGKLQEAPNVAGERILERVRQPAYPVQEVAGFIWTYIGPRDEEPPLQRLGWMDVPSSQRAVWTATLMPVNYLQTVENSMDVTHGNALHLDSGREAMPIPAGEGEVQVFNAPMEAAALYRYELEDTEFGLYYATLSDPANGNGAPSTQTGVGALVLPTTLVMGSGLCKMAVPVDDETTVIFLVLYSEAGDVPEQTPLWESHPSIYEKDPERLLSVPKFSAKNRYLQDRGLMRDQGWFAGFPGLLAQEDPAMMVAMGSYPTRSMEHVVPADRFLLKLRRRLAELARQVARGEAAPGINTDVSGVRGQIVADGSDWRDLVRKDLVNAAG